MRNNSNRRVGTNRSRQTGPARAWGVLNRETNEVVAVMPTRSEARTQAGNSNNYSPVRLIVERA